MTSPSAPHPSHNKKRDGIPLGKIAGVPVYLAYSWFVIAAITVVFYGPFIMDFIPGLGNWAYLVGLAVALLLALSVLVHELAHALSAKVFDWPTEKIVINLWGGHTQFENFTASPGRSVVVALAGPASNFVVAAVMFAIDSVAQFKGVAGTLTDIVVMANLLIGIFNILPGMPLDGGRLVESAVWKATGSQDKGTIAAGWSGRIIVVALVIWFIVVPFLRGQWPDLMYTTVTVLVCGFLWMGASSSIHHAKLRSRLYLVSAAGLAEPAVGVPNSATVADVLDISPAGSPAVVICGPDGRPQGVVDFGATLAVPAASVMTTPVTAVAHALAAGAYVPEWSKGQELIQYLARLDGGEYAVVDHNGIVTGLLRQQAVVTAITGKEARRSGRA
ncbi:site-2 protease family protein [Paenarthrobacter aurescens]|uniref:Zinc metalloprotease n=1 Tax=Paenarthrobacter aurescens TaxID=43663 RepID=A0A4Y3NDM0_PAEAU|nr:site-2 protease family protein [Paenarthrobacter aurescens]MDO6143618.1 site-2 protease family protein [Paenarthrobacter aurescens]MDO6147466.1 site-2 protease family protein [Paenarthrobacter aurescens]MDO6158710.1 site-2 protease family protein [Paenarthrobacter aurescens]MDO6162693.1 site-2 protease family protein [Paenarthrobacter aurescens]GEB19267.1 peptidase M50 [Paenarthrobacter aurescens]